MKLAVCFKKDGVSCKEIVEKMCQAQCLHETHSYRIFEVNNGAIGCIATSDRFSSIPHLLESPKGNLLAISGVPIAMNGSLAQTIQNISMQNYQSAMRSLPNLDGAFAAVFWDNADSKLVVVTDFIGMQPLYRAVDDGLLLLATDLKGITASGLIEPEMDAAGWAAIISLGYLVGKRTSIKHVQLLDPGSVTIYDPTDGSLSAQSYWQWAEPKRDLTLAEVDTGQLVELMDQHVRSSLVHNDQGTLLLSGGFDSRLILCVLRRAGIKPKILIHEHPDEGNNADGNYALQVARHFKMGAELIWPEESFYSSDDYVDYLIMNEVTYPSLNLFIAQLPSRFKPEMRAIWEGVGPGNCLYPCTQPVGGFDKYWHHITQSRDSIVWRAASTVFAPSLAEQMYAELLDSLAQERSKYSDDEYGVREFIMVSRVRNRAAANPFKVYANTLLPLTPGMSKDFLNAVLSIPFHLKADLGVYLKIFKQHFPEAMAVPWCSGGMLINKNGKLSPVHRLYGYLEQQGLVKFFKKSPLLESLVRKVGKQPPLPGENPLVSQTIAAVNLDYPDLNANAVQALQQQGNSKDPVIRYARTLLFYWQIWRWIMQGQLMMPRKANKNAAFPLVAPQ